MLFNLQSIKATHEASNPDFKTITHEQCTEFSINWSKSPEL